MAYFHRAMAEAHEHLNGKLTAREKASAMFLLNRLIGKGLVHLSKRSKASDWYGSSSLKNGGQVNIILRRDHVLIWGRGTFGICRKY